MHDRSSWTKGATGDVPITRRDGTTKTYKNLVEFKRACATCGDSFSIFVTPKIARGDADSNSFGLKNCEAHRRSSIRAAEPQLQALGMANAVMKEELAGLYNRVAEQAAQIQALTARLAKYELPAAMEFLDRVDAAERAKAPPLTFPWQST